jgi:TetR/AcrR family tetracycline transcriptional repressor
MAIQAALDLLDEGGIDGLSMRKLAERLGVQPPSLYWHFASKQELVDEVANALVASVATSEGAVTNLEDLAQQLRSALLAHRDGGRVFAGTFAARPHVLRIAETALQQLLASGVAEDTAIDTTFNLIYYVLGFVIEEQSFHQQWDGESPSSIRAKFAEVASSGTFPALNRSLDALSAPDLERRFASGVRLLLAEVDAGQSD